MAWQSLTVIQVSLEKLESESHVAVTCQSLAGEHIGVLRLQADDTLHALEDGLLGLCAWDGATDALQIHCMEKPDVDLNRGSLVSEYVPTGQLAIKRNRLGKLLEKFHQTGKLLKAMRDSAFDPRSTLYNRRWKSSQVAVSNSETLELLEALPIPEISHVRFVQTFGHLTVDLEKCTWLDMMFHDFAGGWQLVRHAYCGHWLELACFVATNRIPLVPPPIAAMRYDDRGYRIGLIMLGHSFPSNFEAEVRSVPDGPLPTLDFEECLHALLSLDLNWDQEAHHASQIFNSAWRPRSRALAQISLCFVILYQDLSFNVFAFPSEQQPTEIGRRDPVLWFVCLLES